MRRNIFLINADNSTMKKFTYMFLTILLLLFGVGSEYTASAKAKPLEVTVLMYHGVVSSGAGKYVISKDRLDEDVKYLVDNGYEIVSVEGLVASLNGAKIRRKEKLAVLTFDDGFYGNYKYALPILEKYGVCGVFSVVGSYMDDKKLTDKTAKYGYMDCEDVKNASKYVEIASHTYNLHGNKERIGIKKLKGESVGDYKNLIYNDFKKNHDKLTKVTGKKPYIFAYPYGIYNSIAEEILGDMGYVCTLTCNEGKNYLRSVNDLKLLKRYNRDGRIATKEFMEKYSI